MASTIVTKNSSTASAVPVAGDLTKGELAVNVTDKKLYTKDNGGSVVKLVGGLGNQEANAVAITGGAIDGTTVGSTTTAAGAFTTLAASSSFTLSGGTANGVAYLNGSKVVTSGSALTFDGASLGIGTTSPIRRLTVSNSGAEGLEIGPGAANGDTAGAVTSIYYNRSGSAYVNAIQSASNFIYQISGSEAMRLTSTGLGIGTSSPANKLDVLSTAFAIARFSRSGAGGSAGIDIVEGSGGYSRLATPGGTSNMSFRPGGTELMLLDSSGNLGLGVTPSAWGYRTALQIGSGGSLAAYNGGASYASNVEVSGNSFLNASASRRYIASDYATLYRQESGVHSWHTAASGTAGNAITFTQAMTLDASGNLGVGTTSPVARFHVDSGSTGLMALFNSTNANGGYIIGQSSGTSVWDFGTAKQALNVGGSSDVAINARSGFLAFGTGSTERARIDSSGRFAIAIAGNSYGQDAGLTINGTAYTRAVYTNINGTATATHYSFANGNGVVGSITTNGTATAYNTSSDYRLKNNQQPLTGSGAFIDALQPKTWNWAADGSKGVGFIAHEVQEVSPGSVVGTKDAVDEEGKPIMQAMEYGSAEFIANIIAELQSLRKRVAQLEGN